MSIRLKRLAGASVAVILAVVTGPLAAAGQAAADDEDESNVASVTQPNTHPYPYTQQGYSSAQQQYSAAQQRYSGTQQGSNTQQGPNTQQGSSTPQGLNSQGSSTQQGSSTPQGSTGAAGPTAVVAPTAGVDGSGAPQTVDSTTTDGPQASAPGESNTGVPVGTQLRAYGGDLTVRKKGAVIDGLDIHGFLRIQADNVTVRRTLVRGGDPHGRAMALVSNYNNANFTIEDSTLRADTASPFVDGIKGQSYTATRLNVSNVVDTAQVEGDNVTIRDSWFHDTSRFSPWALQPDNQTHNDNLQIEGGNNILVQGNTFEKSSNTAIMITQNYARSSGIRVIGNYLAGGDCTVNIADKGKGPIQSTFLDNRFGPSDINNCAIIAPPGSVPSGSGNVWADTTTPVQVRDRD